MTGFLKVSFFNPDSRWWVGVCFLQAPTASTLQNANTCSPDASGAGDCAPVCTGLRTSPDGNEDERSGIILNSGSQFCVVKQPVRRHKRWPMSGAVFCTVSCVYKGVCVYVCVFEHMHSPSPILRFTHAKTCLLRRESSSLERFLSAIASDVT